MKIGLFAVFVPAVAMAQVKIGVNLNGDAADANGNNGLYPQGPTSLAPTDFVFGQDHWNYVANNLGWNGDEGPNTQTISDSSGNPVGTVFISSDQGGGPMPGTRYDGTAGSAFPDPTGNPTNILFNGVDYNMNHGVIKVVLSGARPSCYMYIYGSGGTITVTDTTHSKSYTSTDALGSFAMPGVVRITLDSTLDTTTYTFGEHGNFENRPAWQCGNSPMISAFQFVPRPPVVDNDSGALVDTEGMHAVLRGTLISGDARVWVYWGLTDGDTNSLAWTNSCDLGPNAIAAPVPYNYATGLLGLNTTYYYRYYASNDAGTAWANSTTNFKTQGGTAVLIR